MLGYGRNRTTDAADLLLDERECQVLIDEAGFSVRAIGAAVAPPEYAELVEAAKPRVLRLLGAAPAPGRNA